MKTHRIYLAARYSRHAEMRGVRDVLEAIGYRITSRWIDLHGGEQQESAAQELLNSHPEHVAYFAEHDIDDVRDADTMICFSSIGPNNGKGGRHTEFGMALALGKRVILVGPREHIFHALPQVEHYDDWPHLLMALSPDYDDQLELARAAGVLVDGDPDADLDEVIR